LTDRGEKGIVLGLALITLASALGLRFDFWGDEAGTYEIVTENWRGFVSWFTSGEPHPPLYFALLKIWGAIFGTSETALRLPSVLLFPVVVLLTWRFAGRLGLGRAGRIAATVFIALHPAMWIFARMARYYSFTAALFLVCTLLLFRAFERGGKVWAIYAVALIAALWSNFTVYLILPMHLAFVLWKNRPSLRRWSIASAVAVTLSLPALYFFAKSAVSYAEDSAPSILNTAVGVGFVVYDFLVGEVGYPWQIPTALALLSGIVLFILALRGKPKSVLIITILPVAVGALVLALLFQKLPFTYYPARILFLLPTVAVALGLGVESARPKFAAAMFFLITVGYLWGIVGAISGRAYINSVYILPWREVTARLAEERVETAISRDWGAVHYIRKDMRGILLRDAMEAELPDGKIAHVRRAGAFRLLELDSLVQERLIAERGAPIDSFSLVPENPITQRLKKRILGLDFPEYIINTYIFEERSEPCVSPTPER